MSVINWFRNLFGGSARDTISAAGEPIDPDSDVDPYNPFPELVEIAITDVIDLHTIPPRDVARVVEEYLRQTHEAGFSVF